MVGFVLVVLAIGYAVGRAHEFVRPGGTDALRKVIDGMKFARERAGR